VFFEDRSATKLLLFNFYIDKLIRELSGLSSIELLLQWVWWWRENWFKEWQEWVSYIARRLWSYELIHWHLLVEIRSSVLWNAIMTVGLNY
jgi:hypothetical protein